MSKASVSMLLVFALAIGFACLCSSAYWDHSRDR